MAVALGFPGHGLGGPLDWGTSSSGRVHPRDRRAVQVDSAERELTLLVSPMGVATKNGNRGDPLAGRPPTATAHQESTRPAECGRTLGGGPENRSSAHA